MGRLFEDFGVELFPLPVSEGICPHCGADHAPEDPHNRDSLVYLYGFYDHHGYWPSWEDAFSHCDEDTRNLFALELRSRGVDPAERARMKIMEYLTE